MLTIRYMDNEHNTIKKIRAQYKTGLSNNSAIMTSD